MNEIYSYVVSDYAGRTLAERLAGYVAKAVNENPPCKDACLCQVIALLTEIRHEWKREERFDFLNRTIGDARKE